MLLFKSARRALSSSPSAPPPGSLAHGLRHLRGETKASANRSPLGSIVGTLVVFGLAGGVGWTAAQPRQTAEQVVEAWAQASELAKGLLPGGTKEEE